MNQKPLIIFSSTALMASAKKLKWVWITLPIIMALTFGGIRYIIADKYEASAVLAPSEERTGGLAELAGGLSGLAGLAGIDVGGARLNNTQLAIKIIESRTFQYMLIEKYNLLPQLLAVVDWDPITHQPIFDRNIYNPDTDEWVREDLLDSKKSPELWEGYGPIRKSIIIDYDRTTRIFNLSVQHVDPHFATMLVEHIISEINSYMRERDKEKIEKQIAYLTEVANTSQQAEVRESLLYLLQEQFKRAMLIEANEDYVYETIDPPVVPHHPIGLPATLWAIIGGILGVFIMLGFNLLHAYRVVND